ncbi:MAG: TRAP transporter large permease subunit [Candidatus Latescibacteria bacterium]|nr:TRAP transporter large permease subunit [Candidatus Latescibacterota bacterium]
MSISPQLVTAAIFILVYAVLIITHHHRYLWVWLGVLILILFGILSPLKIFQHINWNILGVLWGTSVVAEMFIHSKIPAYLAERLIDFSKNLIWAILLLSLFTGLLSAFVENVSTTLIMAPIAFAVARKLNASPIPFILGICLSANLQGSATLVGDPPSMILGAHTGMSFNDFFFMQGKPGLFFAVQIGALASLAVIYLMFRRQNQPIQKVEPEKIITLVPGVLLGLLIISLVVASFFKNQIGNINGLICIGYAFLAIIYSLATKKVKTYSVFKDADWSTLIFLAGIFCLVGALKDVGIINSLAVSIGRFTGGNLIITFLVLVLFSVFISGFVDNIPYFAALVGIITPLAQAYNYPVYLLLFGTILGTTVGGNITPIGASANIVATGLLKKNGYKISFLQFSKVGLPFSLAAVVASCLFIWMFWS